MLRGGLRARRPTRRMHQDVADERVDLIAHEALSRVLEHSREAEKRELAVIGHSVARMHWMTVSTRDGYIGTASLHLHGGAVNDHDLRLGVDTGAGECAALHPYFLVLL